MVALVPIGSGVKGWRCPAHDLASAQAGWVCPRCPKRAVSMSSVPLSKRDEAGLRVPSISSPVRAGLTNEVALASALIDAGLVGFEVQYPWGMLLKPARRFQADIGYPKHRVIVESVGGAHATKRNVNSDCERSALAASIGLLVVPCHPGMIRDGTAIELVKAALAASRNTPPREVKDGAS